MPEGLRTGLPVKGPRTGLPVGRRPDHRAVAAPNCQAGRSGLAGDGTVLGDGFRQVTDSDRAAAVRFRGVRHVGSPA